MALIWGMMARHCIDCIGTLSSSRQTSSDHRTLSGRLCWALLFVVVQVSAEFDILSCVKE